MEKIFFLRGRGPMRTVFFLFCLGSQTVWYYIAGHYGIIIKIRPNCCGHDFLKKFFETNKLGDKKIK